MKYHEVHIYRDDMTVNKTLVTNPNTIMEIRITYIRDYCSNVDYTNNSWVKKATQIGFIIKFFILF